MAQVQIQRNEDGSTETIKDVTRVAKEGDELHVHTPGKGYRVVDPEDVVGYYDNLGREIEV